MTDFDQRWRALVERARQEPERPAPAPPDAERLLARLARRRARVSWRWTPTRLALAAGLALACYLPAIHYYDTGLVLLDRIAAWEPSPLPELPLVALPDPPSIPDPNALLADLIPSQLRPLETER